MLPIKDLRFLIFVAATFMLAMLSSNCTIAGQQIASEQPTAIERDVSETAVSTSFTPTAMPSYTPSATLSPKETATQPPTLTSTAVVLTPTPEPEQSPIPEPAPTQPAPAVEVAEDPDCRCRPDCPCEIRHVVIISIDGLRPDALDLVDTPALDSLRLAGAYSPNAKAVLPSVTLINHASMLGGMGPEKHGVTWNIHNPALGTVNGPTLFSIAHEAGLQTTMVVGKAKLEHLVIPNSVDSYNYAGFTDRQVTNEALAIIEAGLPDIMFIHLPDVDSAGHLTGWLSYGQLLALSLTDGLIGRIVAILESEGYLAETLLIVTADHGGSGMAHGSDAPEDTAIPWLAVGPGVPAGVLLKQDIVIYDTAATVLYALNLPIPEIWDGQPVLEIFKANDD